MATYVNTPRETTSDGSATGVIVGVLLVVLLAILFLVFGLPYLRNRGTPAQPAGTSVNVQLPSSIGGEGGATTPTPSTGGTQ